MVQRQLPNVRELAELMRFKAPTLNATDRRLETALTIADLRDIAKRRTPNAPFDYTEGAAEGELSIARARQAFQDIEFHPSILRNVPVVDTTREVLGGPSALPFGIAPTGRKIQFETVDAMRVRDGKITDHWGVANLFSLMQQLGGLPPAS